MHKAIPCPDGLRQAALPGRFQAGCFAPPFSGRLLCPAVAGKARIPVLHIRVTKLENIYAAS